MTQFNLLRQRRFAPLFFTQFLGAFNDNVYKNALVFFIAFTVASEFGANSSILVILAGGIFILPFFLFSATAGQLADKFEKSFIIRLIKLAEVCIMLLAAVGFYLQSVSILMAALFLMGTHSTLFGPLKYGILPQHLHESELIGGNGMIQMGTYLAILLGTILGGVLIALKSAGSWLVSLVVISVALLGWLASQFIPKAAAPDPQLSVSWNVPAQTLRIMGFARENYTVFMTIIAISWFWFFGATCLSLVPSYTKDILFGNEHVGILLLTTFSVGIGTGCLMCEKLSGGRIEMGLVPLGAIGITVFAIDLSFVGVPVLHDVDTAIVHGASEFLQHRANWRVLADLTLIGLFGGIYIVPLYALMQHRSAPQHRSRIIAANNILNALFMVISACMTIGLLSVGVTIPQIFLIVATLNVIATGAVFTQIPEFVHRFLVWMRISRPSDAL
ncbi:MAG: MFS transporter [Gammaproteobacteria bacterium]|nr:MFS transporter [Gammaproteobacteria bacterium]